MLAYSYALMVSWIVVHHVWYWERLWLIAYSTKLSPHINIVNVNYIVGHTHTHTRTPKSTGRGNDKQWPWESHIGLYKSTVLVYMGDLCRNMYLCVYSFTYAVLNILHIYINTEWNGKIDLCVILGKGDIRHNIILLLKHTSSLKHCNRKW